MNLPELDARTIATVELATDFARDGRVLVIVMIKQRFEVDPRGRAKRVPGATVRLTDEPWDPDLPDSLKYPADLCPHKPSTDVVVVGEAAARGGASVRELDAIVRVGPVEKALKIFGPRVWYKGAIGLTLTPPQSFTSLPLRWDLAWGGFDDSDKKKIVEEPRNPVGRGVAADPDALVHAPGPRIEDPRDLITSTRSRPAPAGVAPLGRRFAPRRGYAGTYDERWKKERMPLRPLDFDDRHHQVATPELITPEYLRGGEPVAVNNMAVDGPMQFELPGLGFVVHARRDEGVEEARPVLDTVLLEPGERAFELTWRTAVPVPRPARRLRELRVTERGGAA